MSYATAVKIRDVLVDGLTEFTADNLGVGYNGWDRSLEYARANDLQYFGAVFFVGVNEVGKRAYGFGMVDWLYMVRLYVEADLGDSWTVDLMVMDLASSVISVLVSTANMDQVAPSGYARFDSANGLSEPYSVSGTVYLTLEFMVKVKEQVAA